MRERTQRRRSSSLRTIAHTTIGRNKETTPRATSCLVKNMATMMANDTQAAPRRIWARD
jgi:hypothetical protein